MSSSEVTTHIGSLWLPPNISPATSGQDSLFYFIYGLSVFFFILILAFLLFFMWKYRKKKDNDPTTYIHGNTKLEIFWSLIPTILFIVIFALLLSLFYCLLLSLLLLILVFSYCCIFVYCYWWLIFRLL